MEPLATHDRFSHFNLQLVQFKKFPHDGLLGLLHLFIRPKKITLASCRNTTRWLAYSRAACHG